ncbi:MAG: phage tail fiber protein [Gammaproteobacteria bacterium]
MTDFSDFLENELLDHVLKGLAYTAPVTVGLALYTAATTDAGGGTEVTNANAYARLEVEGATGRTFSAAAAGTTDNDQDWDFAEATGSWGTVGWLAIVDSITHGAGNFLFHGAVTTAKAIASGDTARFGTGNLDVTLD